MVVRLVVLFFSLIITLVGCRGGTVNSDQDASDPVPGTHGDLNARIEAFLISLDDTAYDREYVQAPVSELFEDDSTSDASAILRIIWHDESARQQMTLLIYEYFKEHYSEYGLMVTEDGRLAFSSDAAQDQLLAAARKLSGNQDQRFREDVRRRRDPETCENVCSYLANCAYVVCMAAGGSACDEAAESVYQACISRW